MPTERIVIAEFMDESAVRQLSIEFDTLYQPDLCERREELAALLADADALIVRNRTQVNAGLLDRQTRLQAVGRLGVGLENIDLVHCRGLGIEVIPAVGANAGAVAEYVVCTAMMMLRGDAYLSSREVARGAWPRARLVNGREIAGKTLGIVGLGSVGRATARSACGFAPTIPRWTASTKRGATWRGTPTWMRCCAQAMRFPCMCRCWTPPAA